MPGAPEPWGFVEFAPPMTVVEYLRRSGAGEVMAEVDLTDPPLGQALRRRNNRWVDYGDPANSVWDLAGSEDPDLEYSQPLHICVSLRSGVPRWSVYYAADDDTGGDPDEIFTTREDLLASLDRLESFRRT